MAKERTLTITLQIPDKSYRKLEDYAARHGGSANTVHLSEEPPLPSGERIEVRGKMSFSHSPAANVAAP